MLIAANHGMSVVPSTVVARASVKGSWRDPDAAAPHIARSGARGNYRSHYDRGAESYTDSKTDTSKHRAARHQ
jgi:hypothetical protein